MLHLRDPHGRLSRLEFGIRNRQNGRLWLFVSVLSAFSWVFFNVFR
jgi:hypothetical protein